MAAASANPVCSARYQGPTRQRRQGRHIHRRFRIGRRRLFQLGHLRHVLLTRPPSDTDRRTRFPFRCCARWPPGPSPGPRCPLRHPAPPPALHRSSAGSTTSSSENRISTDPQRFPLGMPPEPHGGFHFRLQSFHRRQTPRFPLQCPTGTTGRTAVLEPKKNSSLDRPLRPKVLSIPAALGPQQTPSPESRIGVPTPPNHRTTAQRPRSNVICSPRTSERRSCKGSWWGGNRGRGRRCARCGAFTVAEAGIEDLLGQLLADLFHQLGLDVEEVARCRKICKATEGLFEIEVGVQRMGVAQLNLHGQPVLRGHPARRPPHSYSLRTRQCARNSGFLPHQEPSATCSASGSNP